MSNKLPGNADTVSLWTTPNSSTLEDDRTTDGRSLDPGSFRNCIEQSQHTNLDCSLSDYYRGEVSILFFKPRGGL